MITIIASSNRKDSYSLKISYIVSQLLTQQGKPNQILSLASLPQDFIFSHFDGNSHPAFEAIIEKYIAPVEKFVMVIPEYNGSFPGILKSFIDCIPPNHFYGKKSGVIGVADGHAGALRALDMITLILNYLRMDVHWNRPKLSDIPRHLENDTLSEIYVRRLESMLNDI